MDKYSLFDTRPTNYGIYQCIKHLDKKQIFQHVLNYRFNLNLLLRIVDYNFTKNSHDFYEEILYTTPNIEFYISKHYRLKKEIYTIKHKFDNNKDNFEHWLGINTIKCLYYYSKMNKQDRELIKIPEKIKPFIPYLKDKEDINIIFIISCSFKYKDPVSFYHTLSYEQKKISFCNSKIYKKIVYKKSLKYAFIKACFDRDYIQNVKYYYNKLIKIDEIDTNTIVLNLLITYKYDKNSLLINTLIKTKIMYTYRKSREKERIKLFNNLIQWIFHTNNSYIYNETSYSNTKDEKITNFLYDFGIKKEKIRYYRNCIYNKEKLFRLRKDKKVKLIKDLIYNKKKYKKYKDKLKN